MWSLYRRYENDLKLNSPFNPAQVLAGKQMARFSEETGIVESTSRRDAFVQEGEITAPLTLQDIQQILGVLPPQLLAQMVPQLVQLARSLSLSPPSIKFTSQQWRQVP
jgi:hypothetical protein